MGTLKSIADPSLNHTAEPWWDDYLTDDMPAAGPYLSPMGEERESPRSRLGRTVQNSATSHDGGSAFPAYDVSWSMGGDPYVARMSEGMSLRDWFAGQVLSGLLVAEGQRSYDWYAQRAYEAADAVLSARKKGLKL